MNTIWEHDLYTNDKIDYIFNTTITEYDIKEAGYNLTIYYKLLSQERLNKLMNMSKDQRHVQIGIFMRNDKEYNIKLMSSFAEIRRQFMYDNQLEDSDILSIRKDAIFVIGKKCNTVRYGNVEFVPKNIYSSYSKFNNVELFYKGKNRILDVKGISDEQLYLHKSFISILKKIMSLLESGDTKAFTKFICKFSNDYKNKNLMYDYYREFNSRSMYALASDSNMSYRYYIPEIIDNSFDDMLDISYNYLNYILPLIQRHFFKET